MNGAAWCHMFVSWCASQAGVSTSIVPKTASCSVGIDFFKNKNQFCYRGSYTPNRGDIIYFGNGAHVGIVEYVSGSTVHTIEGNTSNCVARRSYAMSNTYITGYGVPQYSYLNRSSGANNPSLPPTSGSTVKRTPDEELEYLKKLLKSKKPAPINVKGTVIEKNQVPKCVVQVIVTNQKKKRFEIPIKDGMTLTLERKGMPGKLSFESYYDKKFKITEGNEVCLIVDGKQMFDGFIFTRQRSKDGFYSYVAYDQLRYLKNKDTIIYKNMTADQLVKLIAERFNLNCGKLADTAYKMSAIEDESSLFDIIQNSLDKTLMVKNKVYVLYDDAGKLRLTNVSDMKVNNSLIDEETGEDYTYKTSIDSNVYNQIKLIYENAESGTYDLYVTKSSKNINRWGVLQYLEKIDNADVGKLKSQAYLKLYNQKNRNLTISGVIGNTDVRAGSLIPVMLNLDDMKIANYMLVEKVTHSFKNHQHTMDLSVAGGKFTDG